VSYSVSSRRQDGRDVFDSEDVSALVEVVDELEVHPRLRRPVSVHHNELKISLTAFPNGCLLLWADERPDQYMREGAPDDLVLQLFCALARGNVARLLAEQWRPTVAYCS
jgi:hypothetical protein